MNNFQFLVALTDITGDPGATVEYGCDSVGIRVTARWCDEHGKPHGCIHIVNGEALKRKAIAQIIEDKAYAHILENIRKHQKECPCAK